MQLKTKCPDCGKTHLLHSAYATRLMACPTCKSDFLPARDAILSCPECRSIIAVPRDFESEKLTCISCGFVVPGLKMKRLRRKARRVLGPGLMVAAVLLRAMGI